SDDPGVTPSPIRPAANGHGQAARRGTLARPPTCCAICTVLCAEPSLPRLVPRWWDVRTPAPAKALRDQDSYCGDWPQSCFGTDEAQPGAGVCGRECPSVLRTAPSGPADPERQRIARTVS